MIDQDSKHQSASTLLVPNSSLALADRLQQQVLRLFRQEFFFS
jgi:hypothetical protein